MPSTDLLCRDFSERARSGVSGTVCETVASLAFGDGQVTSGSCGDPSPLHFTGKQRDTESGLDDFDARYDASSLGRFMSTDPILVTSERLGDPQQLNEYAYVRNNPLRLVDPTGEILELSGDIPAAENYVCIMAGSKCGDVVFTNDVHGRVAVTVPFDFLCCYPDQGQILLFQLVTSPSVYVLSVASTMKVNTKDKKNNPVTLTVAVPSDLLNLPAFPDQQSHEPDRPETGIDDQVTINPKAVYTTTNKKLGVPPVWTVVFHELAEAYEKIDGKVQTYAQGHDAAYDRESKLRDSRPYLKQNIPGAGARAGATSDLNVTTIKK